MTLQGPKRTFLALAGALAWLVAACGQPAVPAAPAESPAIADVAPTLQTASTESATTVVFLGDSLTAGYGLEPEDALPEQVEAVWRARGISVEAVNAGVSGDTTANALARFDWSVASAEPDLLVVALGANDFLMGIPADTARGNLAAILDRAAAEEVPVVLVGLAARGEIQPGSREAAFAAIYPQLADEYGVPYYPSLLGEIEGDPSMLQSDGLHPTKEGVAKIAVPLADFLEPVITQIEAR